MELRAKTHGHSSATTGTTKAPLPMKGPTAPLPMKPTTAPLPTKEPKQAHTYASSPPSLSLSPAPNAIDQTQPGPIRADPRSTQAKPPKREDTAAGPRRSGKHAPSSRSGPPSLRVRLPAGIIHPSPRCRQCKHHNPTNGHASHGHTRPARPSHPIRSHTYTHTRVPHEQNRPQARPRRIRSHTCQQADVPIEHVGTSTNADLPQLDSLPLVA